MVILTSFSPAQWAGAIATLLGAIGAFITAVIAAKASFSNKGKLTEVHDSVNGKAQTLVARIGQLARALEKAGIEIPAYPESPPSIEERISKLETNKLDQPPESSPSSS